MDKNKLTALKDTEGMYIDFKDLTEEQKLRFQGAYLTLCLLRDSKKEDDETEKKETA